MRRKRLIAAVLVTAVASLATPAPALAGPLDSVGDAVDDVTGFVDPLGGGGPNVQDAIGGAAHGILDLLANAMLDGASWLLGAINSLIDSTTEVRITGISTACERGALGEHDMTYPASCYEPVGWFGDAYGSMWALAALFALGIVFIAAIDAVIHGHTHELLRIPLRVIVAFALTAAAIAFTGMMLQLTDEMSNWIAGSGGRPASEFFASSQDSIEALKGDDVDIGAGARDGEAAPVFVRMLAALVMVVGAVVVWIELLLRASAIFVGVFFLPFAIVAMVWPRTAPAFKRVAEILLALVFSKLGVVAVVALGGRALAAAEGDIGQALAGASILLLACLMPIVILHMVHFAEGAGAMKGTAAAGARAAIAAPMVMTRGATMMGVASRNWGSRALSVTRGVVHGGGRAGGRGSPSAVPQALGSGVQPLRADRPGEPKDSPSEDTAGRAGVAPAPSRSPEGGTAASTPASNVHPPQADAPPTRPAVEPQQGRQDPPAAPSSRERERGETSSPPHPHAPEPPRANPARRPPTRDPFEDGE